MSAVGARLVGHEKRSRTDVLIGNISPSSANMPRAPRMKIQSIQVLWWWGERLVLLMYAILYMSVQLTGLVVFALTVQPNVRFLLTRVQ